MFTKQKPRMISHAGLLENLRQYLAGVRNRTTQQGQSSSDAVCLVDVQRRSFRHAHVAVTVSHSATRQDHLECDFRQGAANVEHGLEVGVRWIVAQSQRDAGGVEASWDVDRVATSDRVDGREASVTARSGNGQHLWDFSPARHFLCATNAAASSVEVGVS